jgi:hypothetical protein
MDWPTAIVTCVIAVCLTLVIIAAIGKTRGENRDQGQEVGER